MMEKNIKVELKDPGQDINDLCGVISVSYTAKYDGVAINAQVIGSNSLVSFSSYNDKDIGGSKSRLFVPSSNIPDGKIEFVACIVPSLKEAYEIRIRVSIIEQHKEVESDLVFSSRG